MTYSQSSGPDGDTTLTWHLASDDVQIDIRPLRSPTTSTPDLEVTVSNTALAIPAFSFVMSLAEVRDACARGLQLSWALERDPSVTAYEALRLAT